MKTWHYALIVFIGGCCYGILSTFVKLAYGAGFSFDEVVGSQYLFGALLIWIAVLFTKRQTLRFSQIGKLLLSGIPFGLTGLFYYQALQTLNASLAIIFLFQFVWIGTLFEWIFFKKRPDTFKLVSIFILLVGSVLAAGVVLDSEMTITWQGSVWGLLSALTFTASIFATGSVERHVPPVQKGAYISTGAFILVSLLFPPVFILDAPVLLGVAPYGLTLGLFGVALPPLLFSIGMPHVGPGLGTILSASELPVAVTMAALVLSEHVGISQWFGVMLILGAIVVGNVHELRLSAKMIMK